MQDYTTENITHFFSKVNKTDNCWLWTASKNKKGYGYFGFKRKVYLAHRWSYEVFVGPIPEGLELDHLCRTPSCIRPDHLEPVTSEENMRRRALVNLCRKGHSLIEGNIYYKQDGDRMCRTCALDSANKRYRKIKLGLTP